MTIKLVSPPPMPSHPRRRDGKVPLPTPEERARLRHAWQLTPQQVADAFGVTAATVRSWETGRSTPTGLRRAAYAAFLSGLAQGLAPAVPGPAAGERGDGGRSGHAGGSPARTSTQTRSRTRNRTRNRRMVPAPKPEIAGAEATLAVTQTAARRNVVTQSAAPKDVVPRPAVPKHAVPEGVGSTGAYEVAVVPARPAPVVARTTAVLAGRAVPVTGVPVGAGPDPVPLVRRRRLRAAAVAAAVWTVFVHIMITSPPPHL
ncbi:MULTISPECIES: helix-turn-helix domain-containing protein [unclassified Streptomyces]|uniref:helix-turn-helix domain-containing protein n=1 Tax=unclassified Streptomyces TaxID=2593676 RepID=UPI0038196A8A